MSGIQCPRCGETEDVEQTVDSRVESRYECGACGSEIIRVT